MARLSRSVNCSKEDLIALKRLSRDMSDPGLAERAQIILLLSAGIQPKQIQQQLGVSKSSIQLWRSRYEVEGIAGLNLKPRGNYGKIYGKSYQERLLALLKEPPPDGSAQWTVDILSNVLGGSKDTIWRILRAEGIQLQRRTTEWYPIKTSPLMVTYGIMGLFLSSPLDVMFIQCSSTSENDQQNSLPNNMNASIPYGYIFADSYIMDRLNTQKDVVKNSFETMFSTSLKIAETHPASTRRNHDFHAFIDRIKSLISNAPLPPETRLYAIVRTNQASNTGIEEIGLPIDRLFTCRSESEWMQVISPWIQMTFGYLGNSNAVEESLNHYLSVRNDNVAPFIWIQSAAPNGL